MPILTESFSVGQTRRYNIPGGFFRLLSASENGPCDIKAYSKNSGNTEYINTVLAGLAFTLNFDYVDITSSLAQDISFAIFPSNVQYDRLETSTTQVIGGSSVTLVPLLFGFNDGILPNKIYEIEVSATTHNSGYPAATTYASRAEYYVVNSTGAYLYQRLFYGAGVNVEEGSVIKDYAKFIGNSGMGASFTITGFSLTQIAKNISISIKRFK